MERDILYGDIPFNPSTGYLTTFVLSCVVKVVCRYTNAITEVLQYEKLDCRAYAIQHGETSAMSTQERWSGS